jgi:hypothetical protein
MHLSSHRRADASAPWCRHHMHAQPILANMEMWCGALASAQVMRLLGNIASHPPKKACSTWLQGDGKQVQLLHCAITVAWLHLHCITCDMLAGSMGAYPSLIERDCTWRQQWCCSCFIARAYNAGHCAAVRFASVGSVCRLYMSGAAVCSSCTPPALLSWCCCQVDVRRLVFEAGCKAGYELAVYILRASGLLEVSLVHGGWCWCRC